MSKVIKYKLNYLLSNRFIVLSVMALFFVLNFEAIVNSGVLFSGDADFNADVKYQLLLNNYNLVASFWGLLLTMYLGASIVGPDIQTGNLYILLTSYPSRKKYFLGTYLAVLLFTTVLQFLLLGNIMLLFWVYRVHFVWSDVLVSFMQLYLNGTVVLTVTGLASVYLKGQGAVAVGLLGYGLFNVYAYNELPFVKMEFIFDVTRYKNILCHLFPITHLLPVSYTPPEVIEYYQLKPIVPNIYGYQVLYILLVLVLGRWCFERKEL